MIPSQRFFQDPLLAEIQRILSKDQRTSWSALLARLAEELYHVRQRSTEVILTRQEDPGLACVQRVLRDEKVRLRWEKIVYLGCSAGGDVALRTLFRYISYPHVPIVIAMHHSPRFRFMARFELSNGVTQDPFKVENDTPIRTGEVYFLPGDRWIGYHVKDLSFQLAPYTDKPRFRPLIDQVLSTAGQRFGGQLVGVIMSGMLDDGAHGLKDAFLNHGETLVQDPATASFADMPRAAISVVPTAKVLTLRGIADRINNHSREHLRPWSLERVFHTSRS